MTVLEFADLSWEEAADLRGREAIAILPVGALEAHGPHLPLATDGVIAEAMARSAAVALDREGRAVVLLPVLSYTAAPFAAGFAGTLSVRPETVTRLVTDIGAGLEGCGLRRLAIANAHLDPTHLESLEAATERLRKAGLRVAFPNLTRRRWARRLTDEFRSGACHAGRFEASVVMAARPDLVRREIQDGLPANPVSLSVAIAAGKTSFEEADGPRAYFGDPARATAAEGAASIAALGAILVEAIRETESAPPETS